ncbi:MAG: family 43 glycosylhydrolase [Actinomycetota bacterium]|nr:family 43 glycosylhydrolase [Actinomycetota bacterium]
MRGPHRILSAAICAVTTVSVLAGTAAPAQARPRVAPGYHNPMTLQLPGGARAASCADPSVLRAHSPADRHWYLYCTSDALTETETDGTGNLVIHNVPTFRSIDLVHWSYVGDAFPTKPAWVAPTGGMWAPDVVFHGGRYLMYYAASETTAATGGSSAVGVATSNSPMGPWTDSGGPVVAPDPGGRWQFDPEVIYTGGHSYLYFGSYFGGIFARELTADGTASIAATETRIAIDNRYEGTYILQHDGWYYFMGSATNCCNGPLTGYAVFAARSRSPLGPFLDRDGRSILDSRVGGTPMLTQNGNRWVGTGHNTVVTDYSGQQWIVYHAVDRFDPYYAGHVGYTKRPGLIDPLDWKQGWPVVRGDLGPSDQELPGPAAQPGQVSGYHPRFFSNPRRGFSHGSLSDGFNGTALSHRWTWVRPPDPATYRVSDGTFQWQTQAADLHPSALPPPATDNLASVLTEPAPYGDYMVETRVKVDVPKDGCCFNYVQGGLVVYKDDGNYVKLASVSIWNTRQTEFGKQVLPQPAGYPTYGNTVVGPVGDWTYLRIVRHRTSRADLYTAYTSLDGMNWDHGGTWTHQLGSHPRIGLISMGGAGFTTTFDYVHVFSVRSTR